MGGRRLAIVVAVALGSLVAGAGTVAAVSLLAGDDGDDAARRAVQLALAQSALSAEVGGLLNEIEAAAAAGDEQRVEELLDRLAVRGEQARRLVRMADADLGSADPARGPIERGGRRLADVAQDVARTRDRERLPAAVDRGRTEVVRVRRQIHRVIDELAPRAAPEDRERLASERELLTRPIVDLPDDAAHLAWADGRDLLGDAVAGAGDVDGDGVDDVVVAAPGSATVRVVLGGASGRELAGDGERGFEIVGIPQLEDGYFSDDETDDYFYELGTIAVDGAGDVDGDGFDDVLVGVPAATGDSEEEGAAFVVFGSREPETVDLGDLGERGMRIDGPGPFWRIGRDVAGLGDIDGDGADDIAIGGRSHHGDVDMTAATGPPASWVMFGGDAARGERVKLPREGAPSGWARIEGIGDSLAGAGDFDGDGRDDLIGGDANNRMDRSGAVAVVFGGDLRDRTIDAARSGDWGVQVAIPPGRVGGAWVAAAGDRDGDGDDEIAVGTRASFESGAVLPSVALIDGAPQAGRVALDGPRALTLDGAGPAVAAAGDVDGDGSDDLLVAVQRPDLEAHDRIDGVRVLLGDRDRGAPVDASAVLARSFEIDLGELEPTYAEYQDPIYESRFAGIGDFDGDGLADVAVGAPGALVPARFDDPAAVGSVFVVGWAR